MSIKASPVKGSSWLSSVGKLESCCYSGRVCVTLNMSVLACNVLFIVFIAVYRSVSCSDVVEST